MNYESLVTWKLSTDNLHCSPKFHGRPRYDAVIVQTTNGIIFAHLICIFSYKFEEKDYTVALIQACDAPIGRLLRKDIDLGFSRVRSRPRESSELVSVDSIIRGAVMVPSFDKDGEYFE